MNNVSLRDDYNIEDYGDLNKHLGVDLDRIPYGLVPMRKPYLTQIIMYMSPGMEDSDFKPT